MASNYLARLAKSTKSEFAEAVNTTQFAEVEYWTDSGVYMFNALLSADIFRGYPSGRIIQLAGPEGCGKTRLATVAAVNFQKQQPDGIVVWVDTEAAVSTEFFEENGFDTERTLYIPASTVEDLANILTNMLDEHHEAKKKDPKTPNIFIVIDSIGNLASRKEVDDIRSDTGKRDMTRQQKLKSLFRVITLTVAATQTTVIAINHVYAAIGSTSPEPVIAGGSGPAYIASITVMLTKAKDREGTDQVGVFIRGKNIKNRFAREGAVVRTRLNFSKGFHRLYGLAPFALEAGVIQPYKKKGTDKVLSGRYVVPEMGEGAWVWEKDLYTPKVFTPDALKKINETAIKRHFAYGGELDDSSDDDFGSDSVCEAEGDSDE